VRAVSTNVAPPRLLFGLPLDAGVDASKNPPCWTDATKIREEPKGLSPGNMRTTARLGHAQRAQQIRYAVRGHRRAAVTVNRQLIEHDVLLLGCFVDEFFRQLGTLAVRQHPADDVPTKDIENHI